eukprot:m.141633 g.141633  ORF g.141633 m.141633 type:complete len:509 (+) comp22873_c0_seq1:1284-2810(+)
MRHCCRSTPSRSLAGARCHALILSLSVRWCMVVGGSDVWTTLTFLLRLAAGLYALTWSCKTPTPRPDLIHRAIAKSHTLPTASQRFGPLFRTPEERRGRRQSAVEVAGRPIHEGTLSVRIVAATIFDGVRPGSRCFATLHTQPGATNPTSTGSLQGAEEIRVKLFRDDATHSLGIALAQCNHGSESACEVTAIQPHTVASASELEVGDVITHLDGVQIHTARQAVLVLRLVAKSVEFVVLRRLPATPDEQRRESRRSGAGPALGKPYLTRMTDGADSMHWDETIQIKVSPRRGLLRIRMFDQKIKGPPNAPKAKPLLVGTADIELDEVALVCVLDPGTHTQQYPIRLSDSLASPIVGKLTLDLLHKNEQIDELVAGVVIESTNSLADGFTYDEPVPLAPLSRPDGSGGSRPRTSSDASYIAAAAKRPDAGESASTLEGKTGLDLATQMQKVQNFIELEQETREDLELQLDNAIPSDRARLKANIKMSGDRMTMLENQMAKLETLLWAE